MTPVRIAGRRPREQTLAETGIAVALAGALALATIELGRAWMIASAVTSAARAGARAAASLPVAHRFRSGARAGQIDPTTPAWLAIAQHVKDDIGSVHVRATPPQVVLDPDPMPWSPIKMVSVTVIHEVDWLFLGSVLGRNRLHIARTSTFRDDGR